MCERLAGGEQVADSYELWFNASSGACAAVDASRAEEFAARAAKLLNASVFTRRQQKQCEPGHWCLAGVRRACPAGRYTAWHGETASECAGPCGSGYFCPEGSTNATADECGGADRFCPEGALSPTLVTQGYYTDEQDRGVPVLFARVGSGELFFS